MALSTNLARLRARIKKEKDKFEEKPGVEERVPAAPQGPPARTAGPATRMPATEAGREVRRDPEGPARRQAALQGLGTKVGGPLAKAGLKSLTDFLTGPTEGERAFKEQRAGERLEVGTPMPADVAAAMPAPGLGGSGFAFGRLPSDTTFEMAQPGSLLTPPGPVSAQQALGPDPSQLFETGFGTGGVQTPTGSLQGQSAATPTGQSFQRAGITPSTSGAVMGGFSGALGLAGLGQGIASGDLGKSLGGGAQTLQGIAQLLQNSPQLAQSLGISPSLLKSFGGFNPGSLFSGIGNAGGALGLIGGLVGNKGLSQLGGALGGVGTAAGIAGQIPALAGASSLLGTAGTALSANPYTAIIVAAIQQAMDLKNSLEQGYSGEHTFLKGLAAPIPVVGGYLGDAIDQIFLPSKEYTSFPQRVGKTADATTRGLSALVQGLPNVQSQQELTDTLGAFRSFLGREGVGGYGEGFDPYTIAPVPEVGDRTHGIKTSPTDFASTTSELQRAVNALRTQLPATHTGAAGDNPMMRNFTQFFNQGKNQNYSGVAPQQYFTANQMELDAYRDYPESFQSANRQYMYDPSMDPSAEGRQVLYGQQGYDYAQSGFPAAGPSGAPELIKAPSAAWQSLVNPQPRAAMPTAPTAPTTGPATPQGRPFAGPVTGGIAPLGSSGFASLKGPASELLTAENPNRL